ncbi:MAG: hypothetical protein H6745_19725 [Deltaproteobacteria bacterium]|nr:hypothetical protein [Deltaproteobacteria bacterium]
MRALAAALALLAAVAAATPASAADWRWLPGVTRRVPLEDTASRDAPALELAYAPRAQLSLGQTLGIAEGRGPVGVHVWLSGLVALEDADESGVFPDQLARVVGALGVALSVDDPFGAAPVGARRAATLELGLELGVERARELVAAESDRVSLTPRPGDIPFGGGGLWLGFDVALRAPLSDAWTLSLRLSERVFTNAWPRLFGARAEAIEVATALDEGLAHAPSLAASLRWAAADGVEPVARAVVEGLFPADDSADASVRARLVLGVALPGDHGELLPFVAGEAGSGWGLLVNRHELRLAVGVRYVPR